ncbi:MAG: VWA domain-containing protein [Candidatus Egerieousia sp.]|jgi:Ca-activated chloride channel homolog|nr:VWA domain-containing protein [Bacteroidales bacterium]MDD5962793.1 VWA domain-containing protein [bacterium]MDY2650719.1 VWA domain-containing protein [Candidatus Egerieousia sp.]MDD7072688.1 VWA domain-containing protein [bacterium]MDD7236192.1 VWA domain-containing protein [bacterium]
MFFEYPALLWLLLLLFPIVAIYIYREYKGLRPWLKVSTIMPLSTKGGGIRRALRHIPFILTCVAIAAMVLAIARPRSSSTFEHVDTEGIDIILALDVSTSMLARDFTPDRINAAKDIAIRFVAERPSDRIGVVVFAGESYTQCPVTTDRATLINLIKEIECGLIEDGTAIGNGLATAVARLKDSDAKSKVIILLTDGVNNSGEISPKMAAEIAKTYGIRVYTIGVGAMGTAPYPYMTPYGPQLVNVEVQIDEPLLKEIAQGTDGKYFRATDNTKLLEIYGEINKMEKNKVQVDSFPLYKELYMPFALAALLALALGLVLKLFVIKYLPD